MNWYLAKLVYQVTCGQGYHTPQFDEQLRLLEAEDYLHAFHKARLIGEGEGNLHADTLDVPVKWKFIDVSDLFALVLPADGAEISSRVFEEENAEMYIRSIQKKARQLLQHGLHQFTSINSFALGQ